MEKFFSNKIIDYLNESKEEDSVIINNNNNNSGTFRSTNIQSNYNGRNNNENHHNLNITNNNIFNKNNNTVEKKDKDTQNSSIYSNKDSFIKTEEKNKEDTKKFHKSLIQVSKIEDSFENKEKSQLNIDFNNLNFLELVNITQEDLSPLLCYYCIHLHFHFLRAIYIYFFHAFFNLKIHLHKYFYYSIYIFHGLLFYHL